MPHRPLRALALAALAAPLLAAAPGALAAQAAPAPAGPDAIIQRALESRTKGNADAAVVVFEIADFQCPYCATFSRTVAPAVDEKYVDTGKVQWVFVNMPLHTHPLAWHAAEAALCAGVAGDKFWAMHDRLFEEQQAWGRAADPGARFAEYARALGVPMAEYGTCVDQDQVASLILQDVGSAVSARVDGTPTFIIMKGQQVVQRLVGVQSPEEWSRILDEALR
ncbi:MAG TPA: thioredoxin domain-containing protein [Longimicrobiales bacterium]|nr:thioredoxin domain-containing protein [Longimicrobiales bacterium]